MKEEHLATRELAARLLAMSAVAIVIAIFVLVFGQVVWPVVAA
jgi:hypothetical protein